MPFYERLESYLTVPRKPVIGPAPEMVAGILVFFSNLYISNFPAFSMAVLISSGLPMRKDSFSIGRATGDFE
jgi:hypothetical protein